MPTLAQKLPYLHPFAGGYPYRGSQRLPSDPDALTYLAAVAAADGAPVEVGVAMAVDDFFRDGSLKPNNCCLLFVARTLKGALTRLDRTSGVECDGVVSGDYSRSEGVSGDGTTSIGGATINGSITVYNPDDIEGLEETVSNLITAIGNAI